MNKDDLNWHFIQHLFLLIAQLIGELTGEQYATALLTVATMSDAIGKLQNNISGRIAAQDQKTEN